MNYAYYREPVLIDPSHDFGVGDDRIIAGNSYILPQPKAGIDGKKGTVSYVCLSGPALATVSTDKITGEAALTGMTVDGDYKMQALYTAPDGKQILYNFTITRETTQVPTCHQPITVGTYPGAQVASPSEATGCLLCLGDGSIASDNNHGANNVIDANTNNYAGSIGSIAAIANNQGIIAIDAGEEIPINGKMRVGFVMQTVKQFLDVGALQFFRIKVLTLDETTGEKKVIKGGPSEQNEGVGLGLLAGNGDKIRYSIELDEEDGQSFRYIELYSAGLVDVPLSALRVYYPFWEDTGSEYCDDINESFVPGDACITMLSAQQSHAEIDYQLSYSAGLGNVLNPFSYTKLSNAIDNDRNTAALVPGGLKLGNGTTLGIRFDDLEGGQSVGVILKKPTGLANLDLLTTAASLKAYHYDSSNNRQEIAAEEGSFRLLSLEALGNGDYYSLEINLPKESQPCNALQVNFGEGLLTALDNIEVYGFYYRADRNGDGIPDCSEEPEEDMPSGVNLDLRSQDLCVGDPLEVQATLTTGAPLQEVFYLQCTPTTASNPDAKEIVIPVSIVNGKLQATESDKPLMFTEQQYGVYSLRLYRTATREADGTYSIPEGEQQVNLYVRTINVHGELSTWTGQSSSDWNDWSNWNGGVPWHCTNVIIPGGRHDYPVLAQDDNAQCHYLQLEDGAQLVNSFYLTYTEAWQMITEGTTNIPEHQAVIEDVKTLHELYQILAKARDLRGGFAVESEEVNFVFNENLKIVGLTPVVRNDAHKLIEECMIAANVAAASFIAENKAQTLYRVHAKPMPEKLASLRASLVRFGLSLPGADNPSPQDYNTFCHAIEKRQDAPLLGQLLLRSMSKAEYSPQNIGHFGLALSTYAHFTSPIRRYADLQLHRSIKFLLERGNKDARAKLGARSYNKTELMSLGERCTEREIAADHAEFDVDNELKCILVSRYVGKVVDGTVSAVTSFGAFIHLDDFMVDGLLFIGNISDEYVSYNERTQSLMGGGVEIRMGDKLKVQIGSVNPAERKIDLLLPEIKRSRQGETQPLQSDVTRADLIKEQQGAPDVRGETDRLLNSLSDLISNDPAPKQEANQAALAEAKKQVQAEKPAEKKPRRKKTAAAVDKTSEPAEAAESAAEPAVEAAPQPKVKSAKSALKQMMKQAGRSAVKLAAKAGLVSREKAGLTPAEEAKPAAETVQETLRLLDRPLTLGDLIRLGLTRYDPSLEPEGATKGKKRKGKKKNKKKKDKKNGK